jgi:polysaccharide deacetylase family protein (PEP-CTERM system associated)
MKRITIDLEDWFQVYNLNGIIPYDRWDKQVHRLGRNTSIILNMLDKAGKKATFFVLGWCAERHPGLIKEIKRRGHEIACHGYSHKPVYLMTRDEFASDLDKSIKAIKKACGVRVRGYRAPSFSITKKTLWALDVLREKGFEYDSSMNPAWLHPDYGIKGIPKKPFKIKGIKEFPIIGLSSFPVGGCYFRLYPLWFSKLVFKLNKYALFYIHPWEIDSMMPKVKMPFLKKIRHYYGIKNNRRKLRKIINIV